MSRRFLPGFAAAGAIVRGMLGYFRFPEQRYSWGGPFNGQRNRLDIFRELHGFYNFTNAFESGTYRGTTTNFLAGAVAGKVWTVELDPWSFGFCWARFCLSPKVKTIFGDSRQAIRTAFPPPDRHPTPFFYLDAHWVANDLPLQEEVKAILDRYANCVIMIDDCQVAGDSGYGFDDYGGGRTISLDYIRRASDAFSPRIFFPKLPASAETGERRGCVVLVGRAATLPTTGFRVLREHCAPHGGTVSGPSAEAALPGRQRA
jgi:hypothetical protein